VNKIISQIQALKVIVVVNLKYVKSVIEEVGQSVIGRIQKRWSGERPIEPT